MKTIKIWADVHSTGIFNEVGAFYLKEDTRISDHTWQELLSWVEEYDFITVLDDVERNNYADKIENLDKKGMEIMYKIKTEWTNDIGTNEKLNFIYYSEGLMKVL